MFNRGLVFVADHHTHPVPSQPKHGVRKKPSLGRGCHIATIPLMKFILPILWDQTTTETAHTDEVSDTYINERHWAYDEYLSDDRARSRIRVLLWI